MHAVAGIVHLELESDRILVGVYSMCKNCEQNLPDYPASMTAVDIGETKTEKINFIHDLILNNMVIQNMHLSPTESFLLIPQLTLFEQFLCEVDPDRPFDILVGQGFSHTGSRDLHTFC